MNNKANNTKDNLVSKKNSKKSITNEKKASSHGNSGNKKGKDNAVKKTSNNLKKDKKNSVTQPVKSSTRKNMEVKTTSKLKDDEKKVVKNNLQNELKEKVGPQKSKNMEVESNDREVKGKDKKRLTFGILDLLVVVIIVSIISCVSAGLILNYQYKKATAKYLSSLETDGNLTEMIKVYNDINNNYYEKIDKDGLMDAAIDGMLKFLEDKYSIYLSDSETDDLTDSLNGSYEGLGISLLGQKIIDVYPNSPAENAGLIDGDLIVKVNDQEIDDSNINKIADLINAKDNEGVILGIKRNDTISTYELNFETVYLDVVESNFFAYSNKKIGYINVKSFSSKAYEQFYDRLCELEAKQIDSLIIDLRNNGGGYLSSATEMAELFLLKGQTVYTLAKKSGNVVIRDNSDEQRTYSIVILVNNGTASAAEVLASSLKDNRENTFLIGTQTFGKGTVQSTKRLNDGSMLKYTVAKWLRPNGECVDGVGISPDYVVENMASNDKQLEKALELLR